MKGEGFSLVLQDVAVVLDYMIGATKTPPSPPHFSCRLGCPRATPHHDPSNLLCSIRLRQHKSHSHHETRDVLQEDDRNAPLAAQLDEMCRLQSRLREQHAVVGHDAHALPVQVAESCDHRRAVTLLELVETAPVNQASNDLNIDRSTFARREKDA